MVSKMSRADRAKQFLPFAALKGYPEALRKKEKIIVPEVELCEESAQVLDYQLRTIQKGDMVTATYFEKNQYVSLSGMISMIDRSSRVMKIVNTKISFDHIYSVIM